MKIKLVLAIFFAVLLISMSCNQKLYECGDAPDEYNYAALHYCTHFLLAPDEICVEQLSLRGSTLPPWNAYQAAYHNNFDSEWLGNINENCDSPCGTIPSADAECSGKAPDRDNYDDGVDFTKFHFPFAACDTQTVDVMVTIKNPERYRKEQNLILHAWFDWGQDGSWDKIDTCMPSGTPCSDHIYWLSAQPICPQTNIYPEITINDFRFVINPYNSAIWPNTGYNCQIFRLKFLAGQPATNNSVTDSLWCRFRLFYRNDLGGIYYAKASYGEVEDYPLVKDTSLTGCSSFIDQRDGKSYNAIQIGQQCWMKENLDVGSFKSVDTTITDIAQSHSVNDQTNNGTIEKYCYKNNIANCTAYGGLYQWAEAMDYYNNASNSTLTPEPTGHVRGICPAGWHLPTDVEWCILEDYLDNNIDCLTETWQRGTNIGDELKETGTLYWDINSSANNSSGFSARGGGSYYPTYPGNPSNFTELRMHGHWWATTQSNGQNVLIRHLFYYNNSNYGISVTTDNIGRGSFGSQKDAGHSIRCIKD